MTFQWFLCFVLLLPPPVFAHLTLTPRNQATSVGSRVTFHCQTNISGPVTWSHTSVGRQLSPYTSSRERYSNSSNDSRNYRFTIESVALDDAGIHAWSDDDGYGTSFRVDLVVIYSNLSCVTNVTDDGVNAGDIISVVCSISYRGNMSTVGTWIDPGGSLLVSASDDLSNNVNKTVVYRRFLTVNATVTQGRRQTFGFQLTFAARYKSSKDFAVNDPDNIYSWTSPEFNVLFPTSNVQVNITGEDDLPVLVNLEETITCFAGGNPEVQLHWKEFDVRSGTERDVGAGPHLTLSASGCHIYQCVAQGIFRNELYQLTSKNISLNVLPRMQNTSSQSVNSQTESGITCTLMNQSLKADSTLNSAYSTTALHSSENDSATGNPKLLNETTLFFLTLVLGSILIAVVIVSVVCLVIRKMRKRSELFRLASQDQYLTVTDSGIGKFADDLGYLREPRCSVYTVHHRKSDIYEEINDNQFIDSSLQRTRVQDPCHMSPPSTLRQQNSAEDETFTLESSYITCPASLPASSALTMKSGSSD